jgi:RNA polymerase sigma-70 factor (ECF subfamily)
LTALDRELIERAREYDTQALAEIYDKYAEAIYRYLYRLLRDASEAEDLTSEVFLRLLQALGTSRAPRDRLQGWLYSVARNLAMDWFRREGARNALELNEELVANGDSPSAAVEERQIRQRLGVALARLTPAQQQVILLRFGEGLRIADVSRLMGKSEGAIRVLQHRAVKRLSKLLDREKEQFNEKAEIRSIRHGFAAGSPGRESRGAAGSSG